MNDASVESAAKGDQIDPNIARLSNENLGIKLRYQLIERRLAGQPEVVYHSVPVPTDAAGRPLVATDPGDHVNGWHSTIRIGKVDGSEGAPAFTYVKIEDPKDREGINKLFAAPQFSYEDSELECSDGRPADEARFQSVELWFGETGEQYALKGILPEGESVRIEPRQGDIDVLDIVAGAVLAHTSRRTPSSGE